MAKMKIWMEKMVLKGGDFCNKGIDMEMVMGVGARRIRCSLMPWPMKKQSCDGRSPRVR